MRKLIPAIALLPLLLAADAPPRLPHLELDAKGKLIRIECEVLRVEMPLEFICVVKGTSDHEALLRTQAKPSQIHALLLGLGAKPGHAARYDEATDRWTPPDGARLRVFIDVERDGKVVREPVHRWLRSVDKKRPAPEMSFVFTGSKVMDDGVYAADALGYLVSLANFEFTVVDVPQVASASNELLEWEWDPAVVPPAGAKVYLVLQPEAAATRPATQPAAAAPAAQP